MRLPPKTQDDTIDASAPDADAQAPLRIVDVRLRLFRAPTADGVAMSFAPLRHRTLMLVEIEAANGIVGYGESWVNYPSWAADERVATLREGVVPLLLGGDASSPIALHELMVRKLAPLARQWGADGPVSQAISGADIALWDLRGKHLTMSVADQLGGRVRSHVAVYASSLGPTDVEQTALACARSGFRCVKVKLGFGHDTDRDNLRTSRRVLGRDVSIVADANQGWTPAQALTAASFLEECGVEWIEEPIRGNRLDDLEEFARRTGLSVATGENIYGLAAFLPYLQSNGVAVLQPDATKTGGITEAARVCEVATALERTITPHLYGGAIGFAATLQLAARFSGIDRLEYDIRSNRLRDAILRDPCKPVDGVIAVPAAPGLGIELDEDALSAVEVALPVRSA